MFIKILFVEYLTSWPRPKCSSVGHVMCYTILQSVKCLNCQIHLCTLLLDYESSDYYVWNV